MLPTLNPTAPAFSPPVSIPQLASPFISTSGAASDSDPDLLGLDLDLDLDSELDGPLSPSSEAGRVASALIGESLFKAVFEAPSSPYSPVVDADDDDYFTQLPSSPQTTSSTPSSGRDIWSPTSAFRSTSEVNSPLSSVASLADKETWCAGELPSSPAEAEMAWGEDWAHDDDVYLGQSSSPESFSAMPTPAEASLKVAPAAMAPGVMLTPIQIQQLQQLQQLQQIQQLQQQQLWQQQMQYQVPMMTPVLQAQAQSQFILPSMQFITVPSAPSTPSPPRVGLAPLWPLLSALHRNLARSRPDLYGATYLGPMS
ncbi:hypothetical protein CGCVW01_v009753 [Colletotrichum viniferum]|nr:hypothetical protein CGCVW01_v009753 [Colletotrichum viniferum]